MKNFQLRFFSSILLILPLVFLFSNNNFLFLFTIFLLISISLWEFLRLLGYRRNINFNNDKNLQFLLSRQKISFFDIFLIFLINFLILIFFLNSKNYFFLLPFMIVILSFLFFFKDLFKIFGVLYLSSPFLVLIFLRNNENFERLFFFILYFSILTDVFSYFTGKIFKGPKIYPKISAGKTISGSIGGLLIPCIFSVLIFHNSNNIFFIIFSSIFFSFVIQLGDFLESYFKRYCDVKDSSNLIPGHGGILDRLDGLILLILIIFILNQFNFNFFFII